ncbi:hypothetical protein HanXRQr2_Chr04g0145071 [Helianthus annuus]|uniref:Uncharacterized protein n=1 Tax=Helianthus annuus TaxID=4232 RepID=A0A9K3J4U5_HELAN|nr:hypothetical protein HanXRQr2_Chr04g0145071 [Helianthus annuus]KAJ0579595.1 hypothetical protein HanHA300_Chr04g0119661 [Helianthus annuus]KAJ0595491.1 hypothetical protein HanHA89_Chr04g0131931 [Helianthus annuus]KAJ0756174.1 hypothetical protein HanLR1_Chr04g0124031 [Helianthus annuus]KAJ0759950.1 hypothetical protein HanOQP8_Chr04g0132301 [Helianthus annuus]
MLEARRQRVKENVALLIKEEEEKKAREGSGRKITSMVGSSRPKLKQVGWFDIQRVRSGGLTAWFGTLKCNTPCFRMSKSKSKSESTLTSLTANVSFYFLYYVE